jgi:hypothetical protein
MNDVAPARVGLLAQAFPSLGIGLLVGMLVGLSVSPVVAGVLTTLGGLLAAMLGLQADGSDGGNAGLMRLRVNGVRIGSFGFACVAGVLVGLFIRNQDVFAMPIKQQIAVWRDAGYSEQEAQQFVAFQKFGFKPEGREIVQSDLQKAQSSALYNALSEVDLCEKISMGQYNNDTAEVVKAYRRLDVGDAEDRRTPLYAQLGRLGERLERLPPGEQREILASMEAILCEIQRLK